MFATVVLGIFIAAGFIYGLRKIYKNFVKSEPSCCEGENCGYHCSGCKK